MHEQEYDIEFIDLAAHVEVPAVADEVKRLEERLWNEIKARLKAENEVLKGPASARMTGRVARVEAPSEGPQRVLCLAVEDDGDRHQAIALRAVEADLKGIEVGMLIRVAATWRYGRLVLFEVESIEEMVGEVPEVKIPERKAKNPDGQLPSLDQLDRHTQDAGWGALNHSRYRCAVPFHLTCSPKRRNKSFEGRAAEVQALLRGVAEAEDLKVTAIAAEPDHVHLLGLPGGDGGMPPTWQWSRWIGRWKSLTSKLLKSLPGLEDFEWQTGYALAAVGGGKQGAQDALAIVEAYVRAQGDQSNEPEASDPRGGGSQGE